jgi:hypothetical protein
MREVSRPAGSRSRFPSSAGSAPAQCRRRPAGRSRPPVAGNLPPGEYFATEIVGDSVDRVAPEGARIIVNAADRTPRDGNFYIFSHRGEPTVKRYRSKPVRDSSRSAPIRRTSRSSSKTAAGTASGASFGL